MLLSALPFFACCQNVVILLSSILLHSQVEGPEVDKWLRFYEMGPGLVHLTAFLTGDPSKERSPAVPAETAVAASGAGSGSAAGAAAASLSGKSKASGEPEGERAAKRQKTEAGAVERKAAAGMYAVRVHVVLGCAGLWLHRFRFCSLACCHRRLNYPARSSCFCPSFISAGEEQLPVIVAPKDGMNLRLEHTHFFAEQHEQQASNAEAAGC